MIGDWCQRTKQNTFRRMLVCHVTTCIVRGNLNCPARVLRVSRPRRPFSSACPHDIAVSLDTIDLLLLDEPTNHLDLEGVVWLSKQLTGGIGNTMVLMVSHDAAFIDAVVTDVIHFQLKQLSYYPGDYSAFMKVWGGVIWWSTRRPLNRVVVRCLPQVLLFLVRAVCWRCFDHGVGVRPKQLVCSIKNTQFIAMAQLVCSLCHGIGLSLSNSCFVRISSCLVIFSVHPPPVQLCNCSPRQFGARLGVTGGVDDVIQYVQSLPRSIYLSKLLLFSPTFVTLAEIHFRRFCGSYIGEVNVSFLSRTPSGCPSFLVFVMYFSRGTDKV